MPSIGDKVARFFRHLSLGSVRIGSPRTSADGSKGDKRDEDVTQVRWHTKPFVLSYLKGELERALPELSYGKHAADMPRVTLGNFLAGVHATCTGPGDGLQYILVARKCVGLAGESADNLPYMDSTSRGGSPSWSSEDSSFSEQLPTDSTDVCINGGTGLDAFEELGGEIVGIHDWHNDSDMSYGRSTSLYERHPYTGQLAGEPLADAFAVCSRENSSVLVAADGVNWGAKSCLAARCAVRASMQFIEQRLYGTPALPVEDTWDVFSLLVQSFDAAHKLILESDGGLTTLCAAVICPLGEESCVDSGGKFVVCACNVGDSLAYIINSKGRVREVTQGSHDIFLNRNIRDAGGALGPVDGQNPELSNLTFSMTRVSEGDVVFVTTDGVTDNFDPVIGKLAMMKKEVQAARTSSLKRKSKCESNGSCAPAAVRPSTRTRLPDVEAFQRHDLTLLHMEQILKGSLTDQLSPRSIVDRTIEFLVQLTRGKRAKLEDTELYANHSAALECVDPEVSYLEQRLRRRKIAGKLATVAGKLDHATIVACRVGRLSTQRAAMCRNVAEAPASTAIADKVTEKEDLSVISGPNAAYDDAIRYGSLRMPPKHHLLIPHQIQVDTRSLPCSRFRTSTEEEDSVPLTDADETDIDDIPDLPDQEDEDDDISVFCEQYENQYFSRETSL